MINEMLNCVVHGYNLGKRCAILVDKYSPHQLPEFNWGASAIRNELRDGGVEVDFESTKADELKLGLYLSGVWAEAYELGVAEVRRERMLVEVAPARTTIRRGLVRGKRRVTPSLSAEAREKELERVEWV